MDDSELLVEFAEEARDHLGDIEMQLLQIEAMGKDINDDLVNTVFREIHSVKGAAGFLGLTQINQIAHRLENVLGKVRDHQLIPDPYNVDVMLKAADRLGTLIEDIDNSNATENSELCEKLDEVLESISKSAPARADSPNPEIQPTAPTAADRDATEGASACLETVADGVDLVTQSLAKAADAKAATATSCDATSSDSKPASSREASIRVGVPTL